MQNNIPKVGEVYCHFDDGKRSVSRLFTSKILEIIPIEDCKTIMLHTVADDVYDYIDYPESESEMIEKPLYDIWEWNKEQYDWIFSDNTDYIIKAHINDEIANPNYYARMKNGSWFSMTVLNSMQGGWLDVNFEVLNLWKDDDDEIIKDMYNGAIEILKKHE